MINAEKPEIRECDTLEELGECIVLQREIFAMPESEVSPLRHFVVTKNAGGFTLGAFVGGRMAGFVLSVPAFMRGERAFYSHMAGVRPEYQGLGVGARLKWEQRSRSLEQGVKYIKWTFEPVKARNAFFNLEKLGAEVREYQVNFYGTDYAVTGGHGLASDRLFAEWHLESERVLSLAAGGDPTTYRSPTAEIEVPNDWGDLVARDPERARSEQLRIRERFQRAFEQGLTARRFRRGTAETPGVYLLFDK